MKAKAFRAMLLIAALSIATPILLQAAPSLSITEPPVTSTFMDGPMVDPWSTNGQWFLSLDGTKEYRTHEFYDNLYDHGGDAPHVIDGRVSSLTTNAAGHITAFTVKATIENDSPWCYGRESDSDNSHSEFRTAGTERYIGTLLDTKLTVEFAIADISLLPQAFTGPYQNPWPPSFIIAENEDQLAWYCWNEQDPPQGDELGNYYVPTWDFGDIAVDDRVEKGLNFTVDPPMDSSDPRYLVIQSAYKDGRDMFANRTTSLKISTWIDGLAIDPGFGAPYPDEVLRSSDVSVFHNIEEPIEPSHKMHWPQLPDPFGWDVRACYDYDELHKVLADDFLCTSNGSITKITFWGSFQYDENMPELEFHGINKFHLSLHSDIPAGEVAEYSMPKIPALWEWDIDPYAPPPGWTITVEQEISSPQGWYDPNTGEYEIENHENYFRYEVAIPESEAFVQTEGTIYWLDISVETDGPMWGWKTSRSEHFNDDAVWADLPVTNLFQWGELIDPITQRSLDLAFVIDGGGEEPPPEEFDWGDAPDRPYPTRAINNGANHFITAGMFLGAAIDAEADGQPDPTATGDDLANLADEDGVVFTSLLVPGAQATLAITASMPGRMDAWIDYDGDGAWAVGEQLKGGTFALVAGVNNITILVPASALPTASTFARFRFSSAGGLRPVGSAPDGEVEDYEVQIDELDWGDAPDPTYPTLSASSGANHLIGAGSPLALRLGWLIDGEPDGQPDPTATGDDLANTADEDGVVFATPSLYPGTVAQVTVYAGVNAAASGFAYLQGWVDFNADGIWGPAEKIFSDQILTFTGLANPTVLTFNVPGGATSGPTFARFRLSTTAGLNPSGFARDGEVEDYLVDIFEPQEIDWGDAPDPTYPTIAANNGAHHLLGPLFMGAIVDPEPDGQPDPLAVGDDLDLLYPSLGDDEDGVFFISRIQPGGFAQVDVLASAPGVLDAWMDFNADGDWADSGERIFSGRALNLGINSLIYPVPLSAVQGATSFARFRVSSSGVASYTGLALDGEVEDHVVKIERVSLQGIDCGDAPDPAYPTLMPAGASHGIVPGIMLGATIDSEPDGQPSAAADGDDIDLLYPSLGDDEDGVTFTSKIVAGTNATVDVVAGVLGGTLDAWVDFNADGDWNDSGEQIFVNQGVGAGLNNLSFPVPQPSALGPTYARFRISQRGGLAPGGAAPNGEVEDYVLELYQPVPVPDILITNLFFTVSNTVARVEWNSQNFITYQMQATTNLMVSNSWVDVEATVFGPANWQTNNMAAQTNKFYRITAPWTE